MLGVFLRDGHGTGNKAKINGEGELNAVVHPHPPKDEVESPDPFRQYFTDDGASTGSNDMMVNGSLTNVDFYISAVPAHDIYITSIAMVIADAGAILNKFGNVTALTNGVAFCWITQAKGNLILHEGLKTNFDFVQLADGRPSFGDGTGAFRASNIISTSEGYIPVLNLRDKQGLQWGLRLRKGTKDKIVFTVRDDCTGVDRFDIVGSGITF